MALGENRRWVVSVTTLALLSGVADLIPVLAIINFVNLATAQPDCGAGGWCPEGFVIAIVLARALAELHCLL